MRADIHYGQEHQSSTHVQCTEVQDQSLHRSHRACNTRPVHTDRFCHNEMPQLNFPAARVYATISYLSTPHREWWRDFNPHAEKSVDPGVTLVKTSRTNLKSSLQSERI